MSGFEAKQKSFVEEMSQISAAGRPKGPLPVKFGVLVYPGWAGLDVFGPLEALSVLSTMFPLNLSVISATLDPVSTKVSATPNPYGSDFGQTIIPTHTFDTAPPLDVLIIPGGNGVPLPGTKSAVEFVAKVYPSLKYLFAVCNGVMITAQAGVLDGKRATTNKLHWWTETVQTPQVKWVPHARWVVDGNIYTTSGVSAGLDGAFAFIEAVYGEEAAEKIAVNMEYERHQDSSWDPWAKLNNLPENP